METPQYSANTFDDETEGSKLIECSLSFDCYRESCCRFGSSLSRGSTSNFLEAIDLVFGEN